MASGSKDGMGMDVLAAVWGKLQGSVIDFSHIWIEKLISWFVPLSLLFLSDALFVEVVKHSHKHIDRTMDHCCFQRRPIFMITSNTFSTPS